MEAELAALRERLGAAERAQADWGREREHLSVQYREQKDYIAVLEGRLNEVKEAGIRLKRERDELARVRQAMEREAAQMRAELLRERASKKEAVRNQDSPVRGSPPLPSADAPPPSEPGGVEDTILVPPRREEPPGAAPEAALPRVPAPPAATLLALKQFALRDRSVNATLLAAVCLNGVNFSQAGAVLEEADFRTLPRPENLDAPQRAILDYVAALAEAAPAELCCGVKNVRLADADSQVGRISKIGLPLEEARFEPEPGGLRAALKEQCPEAALRILCLPPLDIPRLTWAVAPGAGKKSGSTSVRTSRQRVDAEFLRARSRDLAFVDWVAKRWPKGALLDEIIEAVEYADWLISLLAYTRYRGETPEGKRMLVRLACLCAARAQRWAPGLHARGALVAAERWVEEPTEEHRQAARRAAEERVAPDPEAPAASAKGTVAYVAQAVAEAAVRAARAAHATDPTRIISNATRAAAASVMAASFAANAAPPDSWLDLIGGILQPGEADEHGQLCAAIRSVLAGVHGAKGGLVE